MRDFALAFLILLQPQIGSLRSPQHRRPCTSSFYHRLKSISAKKELSGYWFGQQLQPDSQVSGNTAGPPSSSILRHTLAPARVCCAAKPRLHPAHPSRIYRVLSPTHLPVEFCQETKAETHTHAGFITAVPSDFLQTDQDTSGNRNTAIHLLAAVFRTGLSGNDLSCKHTHALTHSCSHKLNSTPTLPICFVSFLGTPYTHFQQNSFHFSLFTR